MKKKLILFAAMALFTVCANFLLALAVALPLSLVWNFSVTPVFHVAPLTYGHALGLLVALCLIKTTWEGVNLSAKLRDDE